MSSPILVQNFECSDICVEKPIEKTRKRTRNPQNHKTFQQKQKIQKGLGYKTKSGNFVPPKKFYEQKNCGCKKKCAEKVNLIRQKQIFDTFYSLENWSKKTLYLRSLVQSLPRKENLHSVKCNTKKSKYKYFFTNESGEQVNVCYRFFLQCLQVSSSSLNRAIKSVVSNETATEKRGQFPTKKTREKDLLFVKKFIEKFPCYYSHYGATKSDKKYLNPNLNIRRLYKEYCLICIFRKKKYYLNGNFVMFSIQISIWDFIQEK